MKHLKYFIISSLVQVSSLWAGLEAPANLSEADARFWDACVQDVQRFPEQGSLLDQSFFFDSTLHALYCCPPAEKIDHHLPVLPQLVCAFLQEKSERIYFFLNGIRILSRLDLDAFLTALERDPLTSAQREQVASGLLLVSRSDGEWNNKISPEMFERIDRSFAEAKFSARLAQLNQRGIQLSDLKEIEENRGLWGAVVRFYANPTPLAPETLSALLNLFPKPGCYNDQQLYGAFLKRLLSSLTGWKISELEHHAPVFEAITTPNFQVEPNLLKEIVASWVPDFGQEPKAFYKSIFNLYLQAGLQVPDSYFFQYNKILARLHSGDWTPEDLKSIDADPYLYHTVLSSYKPQVLDQKLLRFFLKSGLPFNQALPFDLHLKNMNLFSNLKEAFSSLLIGADFSQLNLEMVEYVLGSDHAYSFKSSIEAWAPHFDRQHPLFWNFVHACSRLALPEPQCSPDQAAYRRLSLISINDLNFLDFLKSRAVRFVFNFQTLEASSDFMDTYTKDHFDPLAVHLYDAHLSESVKHDLNTRLQAYYDYKTGGQLLEDYKRALEANKSHQAASWHVIAVLQSKLEDLKEVTLAHIASEGLGQRLDAFVHKIDTKVSFLEKLKHVNAQAREVGFFQEGRSPETRGMVLRHTFISLPDSIKDLDPARRNHDHNTISGWRDLKETSTPGYLLWLETWALFSYINLKVDESRYTPNTLDVEGRRVLIQSGCALTTANGDAITPNTPHLYALRSNGDLHILASGCVNHNNVLLGENAVCAGYVTFDKDGKIVLIDNSSGHYAPKNTQLHNAVSILHSQNVFAKNAQIRGHLEGSLPVETFLKKHPLRKFFRLDPQTQQQVRERLLERAQELKATQ